MTHLHSQVWGRPDTCGERQIPDTVLTPRSQPKPSTGNSFDPKERRFSKNYDADQQRLQISDLHFDKFLHQQQLLVGRLDSNLRYVLAHSFLRKPCSASKKWSWLNKWMISNLRVLSKELTVQTLSCSTRELIQHWTKSSSIPASSKRSVWRKWKLTKKTTSSEEDRSLTFRVTGANDSVKICRFFSQSLFVMTTFRSSIQNGTKFHCGWHKSHLMTSRRICTN